MPKDTEKKRRHGEAAAVFSSKLSNSKQTRLTINIQGQPRKIPIVQMAPLLSHSTKARSQQRSADSHAAATLQTG